VGQRAAGLFPYLHCRAVVVGLPVGRVVVLVGHEIGVGVFPRQAVDLLDGAVGAQMAGCEQNLRAACPEDLLPLHAGRLAHGQQQPVALDRTDHGQADARVAAGGFDHRLARFQFARPLPFLDHGQGRPVLDGATGIEVLQLGQDANLRVGVQPPDLHQGGIADMIQDAVAHDTDIRLQWDSNFEF
jgi:hypothetical protein